MAPRTVSLESKAALRRRHTLERRKQNATEVLGPDGAELSLRPQLSFEAQTFLQAIPPKLMERGLITFDQQGQPRVAAYDPSLLAGNPQRGRVVDRRLDELAASLDAHGQQEPIVARLITLTDRKRWPDAFSASQILLILKGHRVYFARPKSKLTTLRVELMLPFDGENDLDYSRRALRRAAIKMMHSQGYDIFDKVNQYQVWVEEFALQKPKDSDVAAYFDISRTEAQRLKVVSQLDQTVGQEIVNSDRRPADEVVFFIANRPPEQHRQAYQEFGNLTVAAVRKLAKESEAARPAAPLTGPGRPRNYVLMVRDEEADVLSISTALTPLQWKRRGGAKAFWNAIRALVNDRKIHERLEEDLG